MDRILMKKIDVLFVLFEIVIAALIATICRTMFKGIETTVLIIVLLVVVSTILIVVYRRLQKQLIDNNIIIQKRLSDDYKQTEALFSIYSTLKITRPLPTMRDWAISPDFATILISLIFENKPKFILEASSGVSTLISSYCLKELGMGKVVALDHDAVYAQKTKKNIDQHNLNDIATVLHAPFTDVVINNKKWLWYNTDALKKIETIDLLIIDGPPNTTQKMARYPALPLLFKKLSDKAIVVLDDTYRKDERSIVEAWLKEHGCFTSELINNEKGATILRRTTTV
jgi:predicted O-methyltransferase YrrM